MIDPYYSIRSKLKGLGLPLFKIQTPYLSSFRKIPMYNFQKI